MKSKLFKKYFLTTSLIILFSVTFMLLILSVAVTNYLAADKYRLLEDNCTSVSKIAVYDANSSSFERNVYNVISLVIIELEKERREWEERRPGEEKQLTAMCF